MSAIRGRFPVFRDKVYVNSCSQGALSDAVRGAYEEYLDGWDENGAEWEHWVERSEAARAAFAGLLGAAPDDVAIQTSVSAAVSGLISALQFRGERNRIVISENEFPTIGQIAHAQELRGAEVVHVEPRAGGVCSGDRRANRARRLDPRLLPDRRGARRRGDLRDRPRARGADARRRLPGPRRDPGRGVAGRRRRRRRHGQVPARLGGARLHGAPARARRGARARPDRLVRGRERLRHADRALPAAPERPPLRRRHAAGAEHLRGRRRGRPDRRGGRAGDPGARSRPRRAASRRARRARCDRRGATPRPARLPSARRMRPRSSTRSPPRGSSPRSGTRTCASRSISTTPTTTSTPFSPR